MKINVVRSDRIKMNWKTQNLTDYISLNEGSLQNQKSLSEKKKNTKGYKSEESSSDPDMFTP